MGVGIVTSDPTAMSSRVIERKVAGGKLFRLRIRRSDEGISVQLTGDFFLDPEEGIGIIESCLADCMALSDREEAECRLDESMTKAHLQIIGFGARDLVDALWKARS